MISVVLSVVYPIHKSVYLYASGSLLYMYLYAAYMRRINRRTFLLRRRMQFTDDNHALWRKHKLKYTQATSDDMHVTECWRLAFRPRESSAVLSTSVVKSVHEYQKDGSAKDSRVCVHGGGDK